jgi:hypothetical protein
MGVETRLVQAPVVVGHIKDAHAGFKFILNPE